LSLYRRCRQQPRSPLGHRFRAWQQGQRNSDARLPFRTLSTHGGTCPGDAERLQLVPVQNTQQVACRIRNKAVWTKTYLRKYAASACPGPVSLGSASIVSRMASRNFKSKT
jgi:hypothetical protein